MPILTRAALTVISLLAPALASAAIVTWEVRGRIDNTYGPIAGIPTAVVGDPFVLLFRFDDAAALLGTNTGDIFAPGARYRYNPSSLSFEFSIAGSPSTTLRAADAPAGATRIFYLLDNTGYVSNGVPWDGMSMSFDLAGGIRTTLLMRGGITDIFNGPGLPSVPDPRLAQLDTAVFTVFIPSGESASGGFGGRVETVSLFRPSAVPAPATLGLFALGLAGISLLRRRPR